MEKTKIAVIGYGGQGKWHCGQLLKSDVAELAGVYDIDPVKREIAESWPNSLDDTCAREEWGWKPEWDLSRMTDDMLEHIRAKVAAK